MRTSESTRHDILQLVGQALDGGYARFYTGTQPASVDDPLAGNALVASCLLSHPAFAAPVSGSMTSNAVGQATVAANGQPTFCRLFKSDTVTPVFDLAVPGEVQLAKDTWTAGESFPGPTITISLAAE